MTGEGAASAARSRATRWLPTALLFLIAFGVRAVYLVQLADTPFADERALIEDTIYYDQRAREVAAGELVGSNVAYLSPLYADVLGLQYAVFGASLLGAKWMQAVLGALTCLLLARVGTRLFGRVAGMLAGLLLAFYGPHVYYTGVLLPTTLVVLLNVACAWALVEGRGRPGLARLALAGVLVGLATAAKGNAILLVPAFALWIASWRDTAAARRLAGVATLAAGAALAIAPYTWRNHAASDEVVLVAANGGLNLLKGNGPAATGSHAFLDPDVTDVNLADFVARRVTPARAVASDRRLKAEAWRYVRAHPWRTLDLARRKLGLALHPFELGIRDQYRFVRTQVPWLSLPWVSFAWIAPLGLAGAFFARRRHRDVGALYALLAVQLATLVIVFVLARYRLVAAACLLVFASAELVRWGELVRRRERRRIAGAAVALALACAYCWTPVAGFRFVDPFADQYRFVGDTYEAEGDHARAIEAFRAGREHPWASGLEDTRALDRFIRRNERKLERSAGEGD